MEVVNKIDKLIFNKTRVNLKCMNKNVLSHKYIVNVVGKDYYEKIWSYP